MHAYTTVELKMREPDTGFEIRDSFANMTPT